MGYGHLFLGSLGPDERPHASGHQTVQPADTVAVGGHAQRQNKHRKGCVGTRAFRLSPRQNFFHRNPQFLLERLQIGFHELDCKLFMSGCHRGVGCKYRGSGDDFKRRIEIETVMCHGLCQALQTCKGAMSFIHVKHLDFISQGSQRLHASDSQKHLLCQTNLAVTGIQPGCDFTRSGRVVQDVRVQKEKGYPAHRYFPDNRIDRSFGTLDRDNQIISRGILYPLDRQVVQIGLGIIFLLPAILVEILAKVSLAIHKPHPD